MKDNVNIDDLFRDKFENFESNVSPDVWGNISQSIGTTSAATGVAAKTGMSMFVKTALISGGVIIAGLTGIYLATDHDVSKTTDHKENIVQTSPAIDEVVEEVDLVKLDKEGDPVIDNNRQAIANELKESQIEEADLPRNVAENVMIKIDKQDMEVDLSELLEEVDVQKEPLPNVINDDNVPVSNNQPSNSQENNSATPDNTQTNNAQTGNDAITNNIVAVDNEPADGSQDAEIVEQKPVATINAEYNAFTPEGDGVNDYWFITADNVEVFMIQIFNKQGKLVYKSSDENFRWDGRDMTGERVEKGVYQFIIVAKGADNIPIMKKGAVSVQY